MRWPRGMAGCLVGSFDGWRPQRVRSQRELCVSPVVEGYAAARARLNAETRQHSSGRSRRRVLRRAELGWSVEKAGETVLGLRQVP